MSVGGWDRKADREAEGRNVILEECIFIGFFSSSGVYDRSDGWWAWFEAEMVS